MSSTAHWLEADVPRSEELATRLAAQMHASAAFAPEHARAVRSSETPLEEPLAPSSRDPTSIGSRIRFAVMYQLEHRDDVFRITHSDWKDDWVFGVLTHPSLLGDTAPRLLSPQAVAKAYRYGYEPTELALVEGGRDHERADFTANNPWEFRRVSLKRSPATPPDPNAEGGVDEAVAVRSFADRVAADGEAWEAFLPWYRSRTIPAARLGAAAAALDASTVAPEPPSDRVAIRDRFEPGPNPRVADFCRTAIFRAIEREYPRIVAIDTGPDAWSSDRLTMTVRHPDGSFVPTDAVRTLNRYGYRPVNGWYGRAAVGHGADDPSSHLTVQFARGAALREWLDATLPANLVAADARVLADEWATSALDWDELVRCVHSVTLTTRELSTYARSR